MRSKASVNPRNRRNSDDTQDSIDVLRELAERLEGRIRKTKVVLNGGITLTQQLRNRYREHKIEVLANDELILADIEANFGRFELLTINPRPTSLHGNAAHTLKTALGKYVIYALEGVLSAPQSELCVPGVLGRILDVVAPSEGEQINVSQRLVRVYLNRPSMDRVITIIDAVIDMMPHEQQPPRQFKGLPEVLRPLVPLLRKWAIDDDAERSRKLKRCSQTTRQKLVDAVVPLLPDIDNFLDSFGANPPEEACALGSLAQAALEAQSLLRGS